MIRQIDEATRIIISPGSMIIASSNKSGRFARYGIVYTSLTMLIQLIANDPIP